MNSPLAFVHLSRMLATTFAQTKVRVNMIAPGIFPTEVSFYWQVQLVHELILPKCFTGI